MKKNRQEEIRQKGFRMADGRRSYYSGPIPLNNASIKIGKQTLQDAILDLGYLKKVNGKLGNKHLVLKALWEKDLDTLREISNYFYRTNGIYFRVVNSFATLFRYDWYVAPEVTDEKIKEDKILEDFTKVLSFLDESEIAENCSEIALEVLINGAYYGYLTDSRSCIALQQLPIRYCRSRFKVNGRAL